MVVVDAGADDPLDGELCKTEITRVWEESAAMIEVSEGVDGDVDHWGGKG